MKLSKEYKKCLVDEFTFVIEKMENSQSPDQMLYYFSGLYGMTKRILNFEFSEDLLFSHFVLEKTHQNIIERLGAIKAGQNVVMFHQEFGPKLLEYTKELKEALFNSKMRIKALTKIVTLSFTTTGNGNYLAQKGMIQIFSDKK